MAEKTKSNIQIATSVLTLLGTFITVIYFGMSIQSSLIDIKKELRDYVDLKFDKQEYRLELAECNISNNKTGISINKDGISTNSTDIEIIEKTYKKK